MTTVTITKQSRRGMAGFNIRIKTDPDLKCLDCFVCKSCLEILPCCLLHWPSVTNKNAECIKCHEIYLQDLQILLTDTPSESDLYIDCDDTLFDAFF